MTFRESAPEGLTRRGFLGGAAFAAVAGCTGDEAIDQTHLTGGEPVDPEAPPVHFEAEGRGPAVVLIHGASGNLRDWTLGAMQAMARDHTVIAFDRPGLGRSPAPRTGADNPFVQAALMRRALAAAGHPRAVLIGHSYGGSVALAWALDAPEAVAGLMVIGAPSQVFPGGVGLSSQLLASPLTGPVASRLAPAFASDTVIEGAIARIFAPATPPPGYADHLGRELILDPAMLRVNARQLTALKGHLRGMVPHYPRLPMPVEILHGTEDTTVPLSIHSEKLVDQVPRGNLVPIVGAGHMPHHTHLPAVLRALDRLDGLR